MIGSGLRLEIRRRDVRRGIRRRSFFFRARLFHKRLWMQLASKILDYGNNARRRSDDCFADYGVTALAHGIQNLPARAICHGFEIVASGTSVSSGEDQIVWLKARDFFEIDLGPILVRINDGGCTCSTKGISNEGSFAYGHERFRPNNEQHALWRHAVELSLKRLQTQLQIIGERSSSGARVQDIGKFLHGGNNLVDGVSIGGVGGNAQGVQGTDSVQHVAFFGEKDEVGMKRGNLLKIGVDDASDFRFFLRVGRIVTIVCVSHQAIFDAKSVQGFRQAGGERDNSGGIEGDPHGAAIPVGDFAHNRRCGRGSRRSRLCLSSDHAHTKKGERGANKQRAQNKTGR